jgi:hypothetical protein
MIGEIDRLRMSEARKAAPRCFFGRLLGPGRSHAKDHGRDYRDCGCKNQFSHALTKYHRSTKRLDDASCCRYGCSASVALPAGPL